MFLVSVSKQFRIHLGSVAWSISNWTQKFRADTHGKVHCEPVLPISFEARRETVTCSCIPFPPSQTGMRQMQNKEIAMVALISRSSCGSSSMLHILFLCISIPGLSPTFCPSPSAESWVGPFQWLSILCLKQGAQKRKATVSCASIYFLYLSICFRIPRRQRVLPSLPTLEFCTLVVL